MADSEFTRSTTYGIIDLVAKIVTAVALAFVGFSGYQLQAANQVRQDAAAELERSERQYLPALEGLSLLQLTAIRATESMSHMSREGLDSNRQRHLALQLTYTLDSLFLPEDVHAVAQVRPITSREYTDVELTAAARMTSSLLFVLSDIRESCASGPQDWGGPPIMLETEETQGGQVRAWLRRPDGRTFSVDPRGLDAWNVVMPDKQAPLAWFCESDLSGLPRRLSIGAGGAVNTILVHNPGLADRFADLRFQALQADSVLAGENR